MSMNDDFYRFTDYAIIRSCPAPSWTLLPSYAKMPSLLPYPHPMSTLDLPVEESAGISSDRSKTKYVMVGTGLNA